MYSEAPTRAAPDWWEASLLEGRELDRRPRGLDEREHSLGRQRRRGDLDAEGAQRVFDGVADGRGRGDGAALAQALEPQRVARREALEVAEGDRRHLAARRQQVVHQAAAQKLAVLVVHQLLHQRIADALG